jgi:hypothetical protein
MPNSLKKILYIHTVGTHKIGDEEVTASFRNVTIEPREKQKCLIRRKYKW